jgi:4-amino-4-deoxy-L-arabinose transferase-like glycosyltransferase
VLALGAFALVAVIGLLMVGVKGVDDYDAWNLWTRKAILLFYDGGLPLDVFSGRAYATTHPDYPMLLPVLEALHLRSTGRFEPWSIHIALWLLLAGFVWAMAFLASRVTRPIVWALLPAAAALISVRELLTGLADVPLAFLLCLAVLALALWLEGERRSDLALAALFLAGAAGMKNEGLLGALLALAMTVAVVAVRRRWRALVPLGVAAAAMLAVAVAPWRLWLSAHDLKGDIPIGKGLDPSFLFSAARWDRVWPSVEAVHGQLIAQSSASIFVPLALALVVLRLRGRDRSPVAGFYLGIGLLYAASLVWAYWVSPLDLAFHIEKSVSRIYVGVAFIAVAATVHLIGRPPVALAEPEEP